MSLHSVNMGTYRQRLASRGLSEEEKDRQMLAGYPLRSRSALTRENKPRPRLSGYPFNLVGATSGPNGIQAGAMPRRTRTTLATSGR